MKTRLIIYVICAFAFMACEDYLYKTTHAEVGDEQVFGSYQSFQGYVDNLYYGLVDNFNKNASNMDLGDDVVSTYTSHLATEFIKGNYNSVWSIGGIYGGNINNTAIDNITVWEQWKNIRAANLGLKNLHLLTDASGEEKQRIEGQMYFFRAYAHFELARAWGGLPYIDKYFAPTDDMKLPRLSLEETFLKIAEDFKRAQELVPSDWDPGLEGTERINEGRITKHMALAMYARTMLYLASPWVEGLAELNPDQTEYNHEYAKLAAEAAWEVISQGKYVLPDWSKYQENFSTNNAAIFNLPWTTETIIQRTNINRSGSDLSKSKLGTLYMPIRFGQANCMSPTLEFIRLYETQNGLEQQDDPTFNTDGKSYWDNLDPRFRLAIATDGLEWIKKETAANRSFQLYASGGVTATGAGLDMAPSSNGSITGFIIRKYNRYGVNEIDGWMELRICNPMVRLSEMYLTYAEAVNEFAGPQGTVAGASLTAVEAVNTLRRRVLLPVEEDMTKALEQEIFDPNRTMPDLNPRYTSSKEVFRDKIRKERTIELAFEGHRWHDIRRWLIGHRLPKVATGLKFDKEHTTFEEFTVSPRVFDFPKHYLLPFKSSDVELYNGFTQNPGWENK